MASAGLASLRHPSASFSQIALVTTLPDCSANLTQSSAFRRYSSSRLTTRPPLAVATQKLPSRQRVASKIAKPRGESAIGLETLAISEVLHSGDLSRPSKKVEASRMLQKLSDHIAAAIARAAESEELARQETDEVAKARHLQMADAWRHLANSFEFVQKLEEFLLDAHKSGTPVSLDRLPPKA